MRLLAKLLLLTTATAACATNPEPTEQTVPTPPGHGIHPIYNVPGGSGAASLISGPGGSFMINGPTAPGTGSFSGAVMTALDTEPTASGTGALAVTIDGQNYAQASLASFGFSLDDGSGASTYLALVGYAERPSSSGATLIDEMVVIVPQADFAVGATVALDGQERVALFLSGDPADEQPSVYAAAVTGTVTFTSGSLALGSTVSATVAGDFGSIDFVDPGPGPGPTGATLVDGAYALDVTGAAEVYCDGTLAGQEAAFASIAAADLGLADGAVSIGGGGLAISGPAIAAGFGTPSLDLSEVGTDMFAGFTDENAPGPVGTTLVGKYLALDAGSASSTFVNGSVGAGYVTADGQCSVAFAATLTAP